MNKIKNLAETIYRKKLLYRSKQRGLLEVDLILGSWATNNINKLSSLELKNYEKILNKDTTEIYDLLINRKNDKDVDDTIKNIITYVDNNLLCSSPKKYENKLKKNMSN
jgi:succinate dehydrogenase flavin-adding protein (antitoxin of CptAB toxin-antitoxin module)